MKEIIKLNIDDFSGYKFFIFEVLKKIKLWHKTILLYSMYPSVKSFIFVKKLIKFLDKVNDKHLNLKILNIPFCLFSNEKTINKYFVNEKYDIFRETILKKDLCTLCKYYFYCIYTGDKFVKKPIIDKTISKNNFFIILWKLYDYFSSFWISGKDIIFSTPFKIEDIQNRLSVKLLTMISINLIYRDWKYNNLFIINNDLTKKMLEANEGYSFITNLFFKNYVNQRRFDRILENNNVSCMIWYTTCIKVDYKHWKYNFVYWVWLSINDYVIEWITPILDLTWESFKWISDENFEWEYSLKYISLKNIDEITSGYEGYIVWANNSEINLYIPKIYRFKHFLLSQENASNLNHCMIIFRELGVKFIHWVWLSTISNINKKTKLIVNYNSWLVRIVW